MYNRDVFAVCFRVQEISPSQVYQMMIIVISIESLIYSRDCFKYVSYDVDNSPRALLFPEVVTCPRSDWEWKSRSQNQACDSRAKIFTQNRHAWAQTERITGNCKRGSF